MGILKKLFGSKRSSSSSKPKPWTGFATIHDRFECISQVQQALVMGGLESSNLIVAVDFTQVRLRVCTHKCSAPPTYC